MLTRAWRYIAIFEQENNALLIKNQVVLETNCRGRLPSFTLLEVLLVLVLTGIVFLAAAMAYTSISRYILKNIAKKSEQQATVLFLMRLKNDITSSEYITGEQSTFTIHTHSDSIARTFCFTGSRVTISQAGVTDTVHLKTGSLQLEYVVPKLVKTVSFEFYADSSVHQFYYRKEYTADFLFNNIELDKRQWE